MRHLIFCPEYPPALIPPGGIGTYVYHISRLLADAGEFVHVIAPLWSGAADRTVESCSGRLIVHRIPMNERLPIANGRGDPASSVKVLQGLAQSDFPSQRFSWQAGLYAETLVEQEGIDIIESQEWAAPLYYFQLRRALGLGPQRRPPCVVFLHSPTEFIFRYNEWDIARPDYFPRKRMEDYSIAAADALFCPSHYLARQVEEHYGLQPRSITVLRYPVGDTQLLERSNQVWRDGTILYVGRLEPRKGIVEWVDAAVAVSDEYPSVRFEFVGADLPYTATLSVLEFINMRIPDCMKNRFSFHPSCGRAELSRFLVQARAAVVPSRWENFPNTCIEAMASGLPVIASRDGGMAEMIEDGQTGWLASESGREGLATALERALKTPPDALASIGHAASQAIRELLNNKKIAEEHIAARVHIARQGPTSSLSLPVNLPWTGRPLKEKSVERSPNATSANGIAIVVTCHEHGELLDDCLTSIRQQTRQPVAVVLLVNMQDDRPSRAMQQAKATGWQVWEMSERSPSEAKNLCIEMVLTAGTNPVAFVFLDSADRLQPSWVETCESVMQRCPSVGIVSSWMQFIGGNNRFVARPCPAFPYQLLTNETVPATAIRTEAIEEAKRFRSNLFGGYETHDLVNTIMAVGWIAVTFPALMSERIEGSSSLPNPSGTIGHDRMRQELLARIPEAVSRDAQQLVLVLESRLRACLRTEASSVRKFGDILMQSFVENLRLIGKALHNPRRATQFLLSHTKKNVARGAAFLIGRFRGHI
ncbi:MAG: glycosyltransferase [Gammaproteobacteria bacterium]|nr:glycosyltransferase [Gammaproteobacteria bacterium]